GGDRGLVGDVGRNRNRRGAALLELRDRLCRLGLVAAHHRDRRAGLGKSLGHAEPDAAIAAGDDGYLAGEIEGSCCHGCCPFFVGWVERSDTHQLYALLDDGYRCAPPILRIYESSGCPARSGSD